jgi:hypothetical protein
VSGGADRVIRVSTAAAVVGVAGIAAYVSYQHAFEVVRAHGEGGLTARLEPATIDGLVYSSMVILYAARHRLPVPALARWLLALGIVATLAANVAHGWPDGPVGAVVAAWPAASLVGSYELLLWLIRTNTVCASTGDVVPDRAGAPADHPITGLRPLPVLDAARAAGTCAPSVAAVPAAVGHTSGPDGAGADQPYRFADQQAPGRSVADRLRRANPSENELNAAAVAAYQASLDEGRPLSERRLAAMYGKTSRRWARNRIAEARQIPASAMAEP